MSVSDKLSGTMLLSSNTDVSHFWVWNVPSEAEVACIFSHLKTTTNKQKTKQISKSPNWKAQIPTQWPSIWGHLCIALLSQVCLSVWRIGSGVSLVALMRLYALVFLIGLVQTYHPTTIEQQFSLIIFETSSLLLVISDILAHQKSKVEKKKQKDRRKQKGKEWKRTTRDRERKRLN